MSEILFLAHRIPFPPDRGDKIRSHYILKRLTRIAPVHVATFADDDLDMAEEGRLAALAESYLLVRRTKPLALAGIEALVRREPVSLTAFHSQSLASYVNDIVSTRPIGAIYVFSGQMGQYVPASFVGRVIADFVDVDSAKFEAYAEKDSGFRSWIDAREARLLRAEEARFSQRANVSLLISSSEVDLFRERLPDAVRPRVAVRALGNGIDSVGFDPATVSAEPRMLECSGPRIVFSGQMDYAPNIDAACRTVDEILPRVRKAVPGATFHVVGRNPPEDLLARHGEHGAYVWGRVPDMRTWLKAADIALVPLDIARGVQNKVLEAMSMALPVVLTPGAASGIDADNGHDFLVENNDTALAAAVVDLLSDPAKSRAMGDAARTYVVENASWRAALASLPEIVAVSGRPARNAA